MRALVHLSNQIRRRAEYAAGLRGFGHGMSLLPQLLRPWHYFALAMLVALCGVGGRHSGKVAEAGLFGQLSAPGSALHELAAHELAAPELAARERVLLGACLSAPAAPGQWQGERPTHGSEVRATESDGDEDSEQSDVLAPLRPAFDLPPFPGSAPRVWRALPAARGPHFVLWAGLPRGPPSAG